MKEPLGSPMMITSCLLKNVWKKDSLFTVVHYYNIQTVWIDIVQTFFSDVFICNNNTCKIRFCYPSSQNNIERM